MEDKIYTIGEFSKIVGKSIRTLQRWDYDGILVANRTKTGRRFYTQAQYYDVLGIKPDSSAIKKKIVCYTRVSGNDQKNDLASQKLSLAQFAIASGICVDEWYSDIGSGLNDKRKKFNELLLEVENNKISKIIIAHTDRFVRFGYEWFDEFCKRHGCEIMVINAESLSPEQEVVKDLLTIIHCFSTRLYGLRRNKKEIHNIVGATDEDR